MNISYPKKAPLYRYRTVSIRHTPCIIVNSDSEEDILRGFSSSGLEISVRNKHGELVSAGENRVSEYLENRVWKGVEIGEESKPAVISMGRSGRAKDYNETI